MPFSHTLCLFTVVMNRLHHLERTLPANLESNTHPFTRFLVLDYNSNDGLRDYILTTFPDELKSGRLAYYRYNDARYFSHSHSRNMAVKLSDSEFVCNVDADNYSGNGFDRYLLEQFAAHSHVVISALSNDEQNYGAFGRMATRREHFMEVGGYDETFEGYGFEDYDLVCRLERSGLTKETINDPRFLKGLHHDNAERVSCEWTKDQLKVLYRQQVTDNMQVLLYLFRDNTMHYGVVNEDFAAGEHYRYSLAGNRWQKGVWREDDTKIIVSFDRFEAGFEKRGAHLTGNNHHLKAERDPGRLEEAILFHTNMANCCLYQYNKAKNRIRVNEYGFGRGATERFSY